MKIALLILLACFVLINLACFIKRVIDAKNAQIDRLQRLLIAAHADHFLASKTPNKQLIASGSTGWYQIGKKPS